MQKLNPEIVIGEEPRDDEDLLKYSAVINVSDTPGRLFDKYRAVPNYWFPIHETGYWGYAPFFGAAKVLDHVVTYSTQPALVHCHAGANRSPTVTYAVLRSNGLTDDEIYEMCPDYPNIAATYRRNVVNGCVPGDMIVFLRARHLFPTFGILGLLGVIKSPNMYHPDFKTRVSSNS